jgi:RNA polymerase sigma factor (sigma-70 family)
MGRPSNGAGRARGARKTGETVARFGDISLWECGGAVNSILTHLHEAALAGALDAELLRRFTLARGAAAEAAFAVLVRRHGPAVFRVCRAALGDRHDAEDAFQATFLVLATKAPTLSPRTVLGPWLWDVARRVSANARAATLRRRIHEARAAAARTAASGGDPDAAAAVVQALGRLPERYRTPVVMCEIEGRTYAEAAARLGVSHAAVRNRVARGRARLRAVLRRMGLAPEAPLAVGAAPPVARALAAATARAAVAVAREAADGMVPISVLNLVNGGLTMTYSTLKTTSLSLLAGAVLVAGALGLSGQSRPESNGAAVAATVASLDDVAAGLANPAGDDGEEVAALVRRAQRLQDRGDAAGALAALRKAEEAMRDWQAQLRREQARAGQRATDTAPRRTVRTAPPGVPGGPGAGQMGPTPGAMMGGLRAGGPDLEARLREVERKLDRILKQAEGPKGPGDPPKPGY